VVQQTGQHDMSVSALVRSKAHSIGLPSGQALLLQ
jgi:hypothetical protein